MNKIGRNDSCHCGSGKKYKKCCLQIDKEKEIIVPEIEDVLELPDLKEDSVGDFMDLDNAFQALSEDYPEITHEENEKVEKWWDDYKMMDDPTQILIHIKEFLESNSIDVSINLGLEHEVLFELVADSLKEGKIDQAIEFLIHIRENYPDIYVKSAGYYDSDIIAWLYANNRYGEIGKYLSYFQEFPLKWIDKLYDTVNFLLAIGQYELLIPFTKNVYKTLYNSHEVINGESIADIPFYNIVGPVLISGSYNQEEIARMIEELKSLGLEIDEHSEVLTHDYWQGIFEAYNRPFKPWEEMIPRDKAQRNDQMNDMFANYLRYLCEIKGLSIYISQFYVRLIQEFYSLWFDQKKSPKNYFKITENLIDKIVAKMSYDFIYSNIIYSMSALNGLAMFAEYLEECGNYSEEDKNSLIQICKGFHQNMYNAFKDSQIETVAFKNFPLF